MEKLADNKSTLTMSDGRKVGRGSIWRERMMKRRRALCFGQLFSSRWRWGQSVAGKEVMHK